MHKKQHFYKLNWHFTASICAVILMITIVGACSPRLSVHGSVVDKQKLENVKPGQMSRREVQEILGSPSSKAVFDKESWYYISSRTESFAFFEPKITQRKIIIIRFDKKGIVSGINSLDLKDGQKILMVDRETPTKGKEYSFIEQLVGNIGTYHKRTSAGPE